MIKFGTPILTLQNVAKTFPYTMFSTDVLEVEDKARYFQLPAPVLKDINITINAGDLISIMGEGRSGKSTLSRIISAQDVPTSGKICLCQDLEPPFSSLFNFSDLFNPENEHIRRHIIQYLVGGTVQDRPINNLTFMQHITTDMMIAGFSRKECINAAIPVLESLDIMDMANDKMGQHNTNSAKIAIARLLVFIPYFPIRFVIGDELTDSFGDEEDDRYRLLIKAIDILRGIDTHSDLYKKLISKGWRKNCPPSQIPTTFIFAHHQPHLKTISSQHIKLPPRIIRDYSAY